MDRGSKSPNVERPLPGPSPFAVDYIVIGDEDVVILKRYKDIVISNSRNFETLSAD